MNGGEADGETPPGYFAANPKGAKNERGIWRGERARSEHGVVNGSGLGRPPAGAGRAGRSWLAGDGHQHQRHRHPHKWQRRASEL
jgi:hypothetical protein